MKLVEELIRKRTFRAIEENIFPGCVIGIIKKSGEKLIIPFGRFTYEESSSLVEEDSIFDVASITKAIPTSSLALKLVDEGKLSLEDKLIKFIPEFRNSDRDRVFIKHLLTQTLDYDFRLFDERDKTPDDILGIILTTNFRTPPGEKFEYRDANSILLGLVIERALGDTLDNLGDKYFFEPLKMARTTFHPLKKFSKSEIVPTENDGWRGRVIQGEVHDESAFALRPKMVVGEAGLFSTAPDLLIFLEMLLGNGALNGHRYLSPEVIKLIHTNQLKEIGECHGLGWELHQPRYMGEHATKETFGKTGFTGCVVVCDIGKEIGLVMLSNATYPKRKPLQEHIRSINAVRRDIADIVLGPI